MPSESVDGNDDPSHEPGRRKNKNAGPGGTDSSTNPKSNAFDRLKRLSSKIPGTLGTVPRAPSAQGPERITEKVSGVSKLFEEMQRLGLEPAGLGKFIASLHKLAVASGVSPENLVLIIKEVNELSDGKQISVAQVRTRIQRLSEQRKLLQKEVDGLEKKKDSLAVELGLRELEHSTTRETLTEYERIRKELEQNALSFMDLSKLVMLIGEARKIGYDSASVVAALSDLEHKANERKKIETEIEKMLDTKRVAQERVLALEQEISEKQQALRSAQELGKLGFDFNDLNDISGAIRFISQTRNIEFSTAKRQLLSDMHSYYANDQELKKRIRVLESLLQEKEERFRSLEADYENEKAVLDHARKLISSGVDEQWLVKLRYIMDAYGTDTDLLANDLKNMQGLKSRINELMTTKRALEEEERLLRQKVVAVEDQRLKTLSLINKMIVNPERSSSPQQHAVRDAAYPEAGGLKELVRAAVGESVDVTEFMNSAQRAIDVICSKLQKNSPARLVLEHALRALKFESKR